ncbi:MAG: NACHT domain-containing protein [Chloroflexi bacterium]|nr:NACHT domain-containing protein [Ardenticatenaceae bacterium]NOG35632.1 NACHT domain-containing protein [Chloroflexota bacterium]
MDNLFILGKPGVGKTTFLQQMGRETIARHIPKWPIFIRLADVSLSEKSLMDHINDRFRKAEFCNAEDFVLYLLQSGAVILLLDGLDEARERDGQRKRLVQEIQQISRDFPDNTMLLTCRVAATEYNFPNFQYVEVAEFTEQQVKNFIDNWFGASQVAIAAACFQSLHETQHEPLKEMARIPLLLTLLCVSYDPENGFQPARANIYRRAARGLLRDWDKNRNIDRDIFSDLDEDHLHEILGYIAYQSFLEGEQLIAQGGLVRRIQYYCRKQFQLQVNGKRWLRQMEADTGILIERIDGVYAFAHLTLHEYFAAWWIIEKESWEVVQPYISQSHWREIFLLLAELASDAPLFLTLLLEAMKEMITGDRFLTNILKWADKRSRRVLASSQKHPPSALRAFYLCLGLTLNLGIDFIRHPAHSSDLDRISFLAETLGLTLGQHPTPDLYLTFRLNRADYHLSHRLSLDDALEDAYKLTQNINYIHPVIALDLLLTYVVFVAYLLRVEANEISEVNLSRLRTCWNTLCQCSDRARIPQLQANLSRITVPVWQATEIQWLEFAKEVIRTVRTYGEFGYKWDLSDDRLTLLAKYLQANLLFVECLHLAYVPDRAAIENQILLPP